MRASLLRWPRALPALLLATAALVEPVLLHHEAAAQPAGPSRVLIRAGHLWDAPSGAFVANQEILVRGDRIEAVGRGLSADGARVIDLSDAWVLPGLIDAHTHLLYLERPGPGLTMEGIKAVTLEGTALRALRGAARARTFLDAGITTVRDLGNAGRFGDVALRTAIEEGTLPGPTMVTSGPGLSPVGGQFPGLRPEHLDLAADEYRIVRGPLDAAEAVRENITAGATVIKIYSNNTPNPSLLSMEEMRAIVEEAHRMRVKVTAHATSDQAVYRAVQAGVDGIEHGYTVADSTLRLMAERGVFLVPTDVDTATLRDFIARSQPDQPAPTAAMIAQYTAAQHDRLRRAQAAGVPIAAGSDMYLDTGRPQGEAAKRVLLAYAEAGLATATILNAATLNAARLLGLENRIGVIRPGASADIIAVRADPLADIRALHDVRFVMRRGKTHRLDGETR